MTHLKQTDPEVYAAIQEELYRQRGKLEPPPPHGHKHHEAPELHLGSTPT